MRTWLPQDAAIVSSDLSRCVSTADAIADGRLRLPHDARLREFHFGDWDGLAFAEAASRNPDLSHAFWKTPGTAAPPGGESWNAVTTRFAAAVSDHLADQRGDLIIVTHLGAILCYIAHVTGQSPGVLIDQMIDPLSVTELHESAAGWTLAAFNHRP